MNRARVISVSKITLFLITTCVIAAAASLAEGDGIKKPSQECLRSETLRVEIGGVPYAFPRNIVVDATGDEVVSSEQPSDRPPSHNVSGSGACQLPTDKVWKVDRLAVNFQPKPCNGESECFVTRLYATIYDLAKRTPEQLARKVLPETKEELLKQCFPPLNVESEYIKKQWWPCEFAFKDGKLDISISFTGGEGGYPPEQIEQTKQLTLKTLQQYQLKK